MNQVSFSPVDNLTITIRSDSVGKAFDVEWCDVRCLPSSSDADVSRNVTPRAFTESARNAHSLIRTLLRIIFGDFDDRKSGRVNKGMPVRVDMFTATGNFAIHLQRRSNRASVTQFQVVLDQSGDFVKAFTDREPVQNTMLGFLKTIGERCSDQGFVVMSPVVWSELPSELWWHVLKYLTRSEGRAVSCTCRLIKQVVSSENFIWAPSKLHLALDSAQEAVRLDSSTRLPIDIPPHGVDKEIKIGRSRRNDVVLLRDPEVSKRHCKIWRDERGDVYIQDLASTNGTKLKKENHTEERLRPHGEGADARQPSEPKKLELGDKVILGLTTLCLRDGPAPDKDSEFARAARSSSASERSP